CTGLALAQGLKEAGIKCIVFEKQPSHSPAHARDWNMGHWGAPVLQSLVPPSLWSRLDSATVDPHVPTAEANTLHFLNGATGAAMASIPTGKFYRLRRSKLRALLADGLDIRYYHRLADLAYNPDGSSVLAKFDHASPVRGRIVVGTDGARSTVRRLLLGDDAAAASSRLPHAATFVHARYPRETALRIRAHHELYMASVHPGNKFAFLGMQDVALPSSPESWTFFGYISYPLSLAEQDATAHHTNAQHLAHLRRLAADFADPFGTAFAALPADSPVWRVPMTSWDPGA
ncbi:hypothetical protein LTR60_004589, partial [Cryomyces antarcticus]